MPGYFRAPTVFIAGAHKTITSLMGVRNVTRLKLMSESKQALLFRTGSVSKKLPPMLADHRPTLTGSSFENT
jgi:hypothetical protein